MAAILTLLLLFFQMAVTVEQDWPPSSHDDENIAICLVVPKHFFFVCKEPIYRTFEGGDAKLRRVLLWPVRNDSNLP
uniref:Putative secreted protein n=1 Tax=Anopheles darlingi TaxID=43151 RepID=A0A2M4D3G8_ANODA